MMNSSASQTNSPKKTYPQSLATTSNTSPILTNSLTTLLSNSPQLINGNSNGTSISPIGNIGNLPGINQPAQPNLVMPTTSSTAAQAAALSQAVAAMQTLAAGGVQHSLSSLNSPLIQARLAAGAANFVANNPLNTNPSLLVSLYYAGNRVRYAPLLYSIH